MRRILTLCAAMTLLLCNTGCCLFPGCGGYSGCGYGGYGAGYPSYGGGYYGGGGCPNGQCGAYVPGGPVAVAPGYPQAAMLPAEPLSTF